MMKKLATADSFAVTSFCEIAMKWKQYRMFVRLERSDRLTSICYLSERI